MLTEEAHHLFVGESGIARIIARTCEVMNEHKTDDPTKLRSLGVIDLPTLQRYLNFHFSVTLDLYGSEVSSNASTFFNMGLKGRFEEHKLKDDHQLQSSEYQVLDLVGDQLVPKHVNALLALNERLRDDYIVDVQAGVDRWNKVIERAGLPQRLSLPHKAFHRAIGTFAQAKIAPEGRPISEAEWTHQHAAWLPTHEDHAYVRSLMGRVAEPGKYANWIAPPARGIDNKPQGFEYVRFQ
jgi:benzoyl-CoA 2,3-dioxygenase component B